MTWRYVDGCAVGTSHLETQTPCQDRCVCAVVESRDGGEAFVTVLSDGAGSASRCEAGAETVCAKLVELVLDALTEKSDLDELTDELVRSWFLEVREAIRLLAREDGAEIRDYAATALLAVASDHQALCAQIGDGGIVLRRAPGAPFEVAIWPDGGEYANETFFVTDDAAPERISIRRFDYVHDLVAFTDGLQYLALEHATKSAFGPFFEPLVKTVRDLAGSNGTARESLLAFLNSDPINRRTNDDKSLAVGCRMVVID
ncbi:MAG: PP2C family serine/threonine-protein phosphatase [Vulcanimicrobiaceae bacterium]